MIMVVGVTVIAVGGEVVGVLVGGGWKVVGLPTLGWVGSVDSYRRERKHPADGLLSTVWQYQGGGWRLGAEVACGGALYDVE